VFVHLLVLLLDKLFCLPGITVDFATDTKVLGYNRYLLLLTGLVSNGCYTCIYTFMTVARSVVYNADLLVARVLMK
jgi:hypothetical protein